ncbi:MAG TPA: OmpA family protein [Polyangia bacterium]|jgi:peptidoglycan-associated lipoprotein|nr:OmpA family protein [Polyangia bacterium]
MTPPWSRNLGWLFGLALAVGCSHEQSRPPKVAADSDEPKPRPASHETQKEPDPLPPETPTTVADDNPGAIFFDFDSSTLREDARDTLAKVATDLKEKDATAKIAIEGNCDALGTVEYNLALGQHRAEAAKTYLVEMGVPKKRIRTASYGSQRPKYPGHDEDAYAKNRRDDLIVH